MLLFYCLLLLAAASVIVDVSAVVASTDVLVVVSATYAAVIDAIVAAAAAAAAAAAGVTPLTSLTEHLVRSLPPPPCRSLSSKLSISNNSTSVLSDDDEWAALASRLGREQLHPNHSLLVRLAERRVRVIRARIKRVDDIEEERALLRRQAELFAGLRAAMAAADPPGDLWDAAAEKADRALSKFDRDHPKA